MCFGALAALLPEVDKGKGTVTSSKSVEQAERINSKGDLDGALGRFHQGLAMVSAVS